MFRTIILALALAMVTAAVAAPAHDWRRHLNARFGTSAEYPAEMFGAGVEADNGDGTTWEGPDGAKLLVFGFWNTDKATPATYETTLRASDPSRYASVSYRLANRRALVLSGTVGGKVFYERYAFGDPSGAIHAMVIEYPAAARETFDPIVGRMSSSLRWGERGRAR